MRITNPRWRTAAILEKSPYLHISAPNTGEVQLKISHLSRNISPPLRNGVRQGHSYYRRLIGSRMRFLERCYYRERPITVQTTPFSTPCVAFPVFVMGGDRNFKFGTQADYGKSWPMDDKPPLKEAWSTSSDFYKFWNGRSQTLQINHSEFQSIQMTGACSGSRHVTRLNFLIM